MVYTSDKQKRLNSVQQCGPICNPSTHLDKSSQANPKCRDCVMIDKTTTTTILDGIQQVITQKKIKLCDKHLAEDSPPPPIPDLINLSISTEMILHSLETDADPLNLLFLDTGDSTFAPSSTPSPNTTPAIQSTPAPISLPNPPPPPSPSSSNAGPLRRQRKPTGRQETEKNVHNTYADFIHKVNNGSSLNKLFIDRV